MAHFAYSPMFPLGPDDTDYELVSAAHVKLVEMDGETFLRVDPKGLTLLAERAFTDISHLLRSSHLGQLATILDDPEATNNDRFVALEMIKNLCGKDSIKWDESISAAQEALQKRIGLWDGINHQINKKEKVKI